MTIDPLASPAQPQPATIEEWLAIPEEQRAELIGGRIVRHAMPGPTHGVVQRAIGARLDPFHRRKGDDDAPGGWWVSQEVDMFIGGVGCRPDLIGWQREVHPTLPAPNARGVVTEVPEWVCEVLSASTAAYDTGAKRDAYHRAGVRWYWLADPLYRTLTVLRRIEEGYLIVRAATLGERVRVEPFEAVEIEVGELFDFGEEAPTETAGT